MIYALVILAQLTAAPPPVLPDGAFCDEGLITTTLNLDEGRVLTTLREPTGRPVRALLRRLDGKPMTCDPFFAWVSHYFTCGASCEGGVPYQANGHMGGTTRANACLNARNDGCSQTACSPGTYRYCGFIEAFSGAAYGNCVYGELRDCVGSGGLTDDCSDWY